MASLSTQVKARLLLNTLAGIVLTTLKWTIGDFKINWGFTLGMIGWFLAYWALSGAIANDQGDPIPIISFAASLFGFMASVAGLYIYYTGPEKTTNDVISKVLASIAEGLLWAGLALTSSVLLYKAREVSQFLGGE